MPLTGFSRGNRRTQKSRMVKPIGVAHFAGLVTRLRGSTTGIAAIREPHTDFPACGLSPEAEPVSVPHGLDARQMDGLPPGVCRAGHRHVAAGFSSPVLGRGVLLPSLARQHDKRWRGPH
jgi:hypothetical protein